MRRNIVSEPTKHTEGYTTRSYSELTILIPVSAHAHGRHKPYSADFNQDVFSKEQRRGINEAVCV